MRDSSRRFEKRVLVRRASGNRSARKVIAVAFDGEKTEAEYFRGWSRRLGTVGIVLAPFYVKSGGNALFAVQASARLSKTEGPFDEMWCVCDVDDTSPQNLRSAKALAVRENVSLCLSCRCFEVWLALHWGPISLAEIKTERDAVALVAGCHDKYHARDKHIPFEVLFARTKQACDNAEWLSRQAMPNPATDVHQLVRKLLAVFDSRNKNFNG